MILKTEVAFVDTIAEKLGLEESEENFIWGTFYIDLKEVGAFGEYVKDGLPDNRITEIHIKNLGGRLLRIPVSEFAKHMQKVWGKYE